MRFIWHIARAVAGGRHASRSGGEVYEVLAANPQLRFDAEQKYWNFGLWDQQPKTMGEACEALVQKIATLGEIEQARRVLDVGFGLGQQLEVWDSRTEARVVGIDLCKGHAHAAAESESRATLTVGDAVSLPFRSDSFDLLICVEAAFHFNCRADFLLEAARVLAPNGVLVMGDILPGSRRSWFSSLWWVAFRRTMYVPHENCVDLATFEREFRHAGFVPQIEDVTPSVFVPFFEAAGRALGGPLARKGCAQIAKAFRRHAPCQYVLVRAESH